jgi:hypothetical protein
MPLAPGPDAVWSGGRAPFLMEDTSSPYGRDIKTQPLTPSLELKVSIMFLNHLLRQVN